MKRSASRTTRPVDKVAEPSAQSGARDHSQRTGSRSKAPVFVLGCPRSGTTLLYHMLLSSGGFAVYRTESHTFSLLAPRFGPLDRSGAKEKLMDEWLKSMLFRRSGLDPGEIRAKIEADCHNAGDFLRIVMESIAEQQQVERWAECTPAHLLNIPQIKRTIPGAKILHIIRDGRDASLSLEKLGWIRPMPWDQGRELLVAGLYWAWIVQKGRWYGRAFPQDYMELRFEELIANPHEVLARVGRFIDHDLDHDRILEAGIGSVTKPNTSFAAGAQFDPLARWRKAMSAEQMRAFECLVGPDLRELGYDLAYRPEDLRPSPKLRAMKAFYPRLFSAKQWVKTSTPAGRYLVNTSLIHEDGGLHNPPSGFASNGMSSV